MEKSINSSEGKSERMKMGAINYNKKENFSHKVEH